MLITVGIQFRLKLALLCLITPFVNLTKLAFHTEISPEQNTTNTTMNSHAN